MKIPRSWPRVVLGAAVWLGFAAAARAASSAAQAARSGNIPELKAQLDAGEDVNSPAGPQGQTLLELAAEGGQLGSAKLLLDRGADVSIRRRGTSALTIACLRGDAEMAALLVSRGAPVTRREIDLAEGPARKRIVALLEEAQAKQQAALEQAKAASAAAAVGSTEPVSGVDVPSYALGKRREDFALVVGLESYMDAPEAPYAQRDARAVRAHLEALGVPARNIVLLSGRAAGRAGLERYLERWLPDNVSANGRFFFYFAGDGAADAAGRGYLLPWDGDAGQLEATGYPLSRLFEKLNALGARETVAVVDAGFFGTARAAGGGQPAKLDLGRRELGGVSAVLADDGSGQASTLGAHSHGALTYRLLEGLNGAALDAKGRASLAGLFRYAQPRVEHDASKQGRRQAPVLLLGGSGDVLLRSATLAR